MNKPAATKEEEEDIRDSHSIIRGDDCGCLSDHKSVNKRIRKDLKSDFEKLLTSQMMRKNEIQKCSQEEELSG